jgi:Redoxin
MLVIFTLILAMVSSTGGDTYPSGPQVGDKLAEFKAHAFSGPDAGKDFKLLKKTKGGPTLVIFMHHASEPGITRPGLQFLRPVDKYAAENAKLAAHIVWVTGNQEKTEAFLKRAENSLNLQSPISICLDGGKDGPAAYGLNDKVAITVLVAKDGKVVANFALVDPNAKDSAKVIAALTKVLGKDPQR